MSFSILLFVLLLTKCNTTLSHLGQQFNNLQQAALSMLFRHHWFNMALLLTSSVQYDKVLFKFGQQQLVMVNYAYGFNQSEMQGYQ